MTSFNVVDYIPSTGNKWLLTEVLRNQWGFDGFAVSDYTSINEMSQHGLGDLKTVSALALKAGTDMDMVGEGFLTTLKQSLEEGLVTRKEINNACRRILEAKYKLGLFDDPFRYIDEKSAETDIMSAEHLEFARKIGSRSIVLLKNKNQILPLTKSGTIAVIGPLADSEEDMLGTWVVSADKSRIVSIIEGVRNVGGNNVNVLYAKGSEFSDDEYLLNNIQSTNSTAASQQAKTSPDEMIKEAVTAANKADVVIAALGEAASWSGEAASRSDISIPQCQKTLLKALLDTGKPVVLVLVNGRPLTLVWENENVDAILETWNAGTEAGNAIADVLFGDYNPAGKLTATFPVSVGQIPIYYNHLNTGRPISPASPGNKYASKYLDIPNEPLYPFGYGLSYTSFEYSEIQLSKQQLKGNGTLDASVTVTNTGKYAGEEVVQLYIQDPVASISRPVKELKNFRKIMLQPGQRQVVSFSITKEDLKFYNSKLNYVWEPGEFKIYIGTSSENLKTSSVNWRK
jgi:beta-glucosidase